MNCIEKIVNRKSGSPIIHTIHSYTENACTYHTPNSVSHSLQEILRNDLQITLPSVKGKSPVRTHPQLILVVCKFRDSDPGALIYINDAHARMHALYSSLPVIICNSRCVFIAFINGRWKFFIKISKMVTVMRFITFATFVCNYVELPVRAHNYQLFRFTIH
jgi:hypothetical protein